VKPSRDVVPHRGISTGYVSPFRKQLSELLIFVERKTERERERKKMKILSNLIKNSQKKSRLLIEFPRKILDAAVVNYMSSQFTIE